MNGVDLFAGAGGWSLGFEQAAGCSPLIAVNHCAHAAAVHRSIGQRAHTSPPYWGLRDYGVDGVDDPTGGR